MPYTLEGVWSGSSVAGVLGTGSVSRAVFTLLPQGGKPGQELLQTLLMGLVTAIGGRNGHQGCLGFADGMQESDRVQTGAAPSLLLFSFLGHSLVFQQPVTGSGRWAVSFDGGRSLPVLLQQLEGGLEVVHVESQGLVEFDRHLAGQGGPSSGGDQRTSAPRPRSFARYSPGHCCGKPGNG